MKKIVIAFIFNLLVLPFLAGAQDSRLIIDSGHNNSVDALAYHHGQNVLISADNTGLVKIWDLETSKLTHQINTGRRGSIEIKVHPTLPQFVILVSRPGSTEMAVWDWKRQVQLFTKEMSDRPVQFDYSARGKYLFVTRVSSPSITLMDSRTGREYSYLKRLYNLFSFGYIGPNETTLMTYSNSGSIKYWDIRTSSLKHETSTLMDLTDLTVLQNEGKGFFVARKGTSLYLVDRLKGTVVDSVSYPDLRSFSVDEESGRIAVAELNSNGRLRISLTGTAGGRFSPSSLKSYLDSASVSTNGLPDDTGHFRLTGTMKSLLAGRGKIFLADEQGTIWNIDSLTLKPETWKSNNIQNIRDLSFSEDNLYILSSDSLTALNSGFIGQAGVPKLDLFSDLTINKAPSPLPGESEIEMIDSGSMIVWNRENSRKGYVVYDPSADRIQNRNSDFNSPISQLSVRNGQILVLESSGEASLKNIHTGITDFQFSALGMVSLNFLDGKTLLAGKSLMKSGRNPMFTVQTATGEIIPFEDNRFLVYNIISPEEGNKIYTVGLSQNSSGGVETVVRSHDKSDPSRTSTLYTRAGEWVNAIFTVDTASYTPTLYGTVTGRDLIRISGTRKRTWEYDRNIEKIFFHRSVLYILNTDGSLTLFDPVRGKKILDFYMMKDNNWIAVPADSGSGPYISNQEAAEYLNSFSPLTGSTMRNRYVILDMEDAPEDM